jgi:hypothetical protein
VKFDFYSTFIAISLSIFADFGNLSFLFQLLFELDVQIFQFYSTSNSVCKTGKIDKNGLKIKQKKKMKNEF